MSLFCLDKLCRGVLANHLVFQKYGTGAHKCRERKSGSEMLCAFDGLDKLLICNNNVITLSEDLHFDETATLPSFTLKLCRIFKESVAINLPFRTLIFGQRCSLRVLDPLLLNLPFPV